MGNRAVLYLRLSKEDADKLQDGDESASIMNQRLLLTEYALNMDFKIVKVYSDDDESGLYDDRPGFERMIEDSRLGMFDIVIAKSQSRFSRNMEHIERYLHHDFPMLGIRFIGIADDADTDNPGNKKARQINGLVNEWYCEDLSHNIKSVFRAKMKDGQFIGATCPYGYKKDPDNHNHLVIDDYAAGVVRKIYALYIGGCGKGKIATILSDEGILIPTVYKREVLGINYYNSMILSGTKTWSYQTVHSILNNRVYTGDLIQNKYKRVSYKDKRKVQVPEDERIIVENTHEAVIDRNTYALAQELQRKRTRSVKTGGMPGVFSGKCICADCGKSMERRYGAHGKHEMSGYICRTYKTRGRKYCPGHFISNDDLEAAVLTSMRKEARDILKKDDIEMLKKYASDMSGKIRPDCNTDSLKKKLDIILGYKRSAFEKYISGTISESDYNEYSAGYKRQIEVLESHINKISQERGMAEATEGACRAWIESFIDFINTDRLDRHMIAGLIDKIEVSGDGSITVFYKFHR